MNLAINKLILCCMISIALLTACEKADIQKPLVDDKPLAIRTTEINCHDCPVEDCCCAVELEEGDMASIEICGSSSPNNSLTPCGPDVWGNCTIQGFLLTYSLTDPQNPIEIFCMPPASALSIKVTGGSNVRARVSCRYGQSGATSVDVFPGKTNIYVDESCDVSTICP